MKSSSVDFLPMTLRTRFLITALFLCHQLPASSLVTMQLPSEPDPETSSAQPNQQKNTEIHSTPCAAQAASEDSDSTTVCAHSQELIGSTWKLHGNAEIHYRSYVVRADELTYNRDTGEATATGHFRIDGGPNDDHIRASHGTYNVTAETGRFYDVTATTGLRFTASQTILTSTAPFAFSGKVVEKTGPEHYVVYDGSITT